MAGTQEGDKPDTIFHLSAGKAIILCGYRNPKKEEIFSEFILSICGQDTIIDFWPAVLSCRLKLHKDTLFVDQIENFPTGDNFKFQEAVWTTEKIYFSNGEMIRHLNTNKAIRKYTKHEIETVLTEFENKQKAHDEENITIASKLFIAAISGSEKARRCFLEFDNKFSPDGGDKEIYSDLTAMLQLWQKK